MSMRTGGDNPYQNISYYSIPSEVANALKKDGVQLTYIKIDKNSSINDKLKVFFLSLKSSVHTEGTGDEKHYFFLNSKDELGEQLLDIYKNKGSDGLKTAGELLLRNDSRGDTLRRQVMAVNLLKNEKYIGQDTKLRRDAAKALLGNEKKYEGEGILVTRKLDRYGIEKINVYHIDKGEKLGEGTYNTVRKIREEVFGKTVDKKGKEIDKYKDKQAAFKYSHKAGGDATDDVGALEWTKELNGGEVPYGCQKPPKAVGKNEQVTKLQKVGDLEQAKLTPRQALRAMRSPISFLLKMQEFGIAHTDIKAPNLLVEKTKEGKAEAVVADFGGVNIFPDLKDLNTEGRKAMATKMLEHMKSIKNINNQYEVPKDEFGFLVSPNQQTGMEINNYRAALKRVLPDLQKIAKGEDPSPEFEKNYSDMKAGIAKMQIIQMGCTLARAVLGEEAFSNCIFYSRDDGSFLKPDTKTIQDQIELKFGKNNSSKELYELINDMLDPNPDNRPTAEQVNERYEKIMKKLA